jgi:hypothetical protein
MEGFDSPWRSFSSSGAALVALPGALKPAKVDTSWRGVSCCAVTVVCRVSCGASMAACKASWELVALSTSLTFEPVGHRVDSPASAGAVTLARALAWSHRAEACSSIAETCPCTAAVSIRATDGGTVSTEAAKSSVSGTGARCDRWWKSVEGDSGCSSEGFASTDCGPSSRSPGVPKRQGEEGLGLFAGVLESDKGACGVVGTGARSDCVPLSWVERSSAASPSIGWLKTGC